MNQAFKIPVAISAADYLEGENTVRFIRSFLPLPFAHLEGWLER